ncbi:MAG: serine/threonine protein kinase [Gemmatimonadetes bacterium]|nr:serine/threonine protein kinase [Gemmatimonadota bacterium]
MPDPVAPAGEDPELRALVEQALQATYELGAEIGRGGMGIVYRARDRRLKRQVAIKLLPPELSFRRDVRTRFLREAETAAQLSHPNIVPIYSVDEIGNLVFFVMACVDGDNLARQLQQRGALPIDQVRRWTREVSEALAYAHSRGVIHRDIKPDNILVDAIDGRAVVTDFGIARAASESGDASRLTATGAAIGTPAYMSPEQASGDRDVDARSDLYSLGVVAYQMLSGETPFTAGTMPAMLVKHLAETPVPVAQRRPDVPPDLAELVMRLLAKSPADRIQSATEVSQAIGTGVLPPAPERARAAGGAARSPIPLDGSPIGGMPPGGAPSPATYRAPSYTERTGVVSVAGVAEGAGMAPSAPRAAGSGGATAAEMVRWEAVPVERFRKKLGPYLIVNSVILVLAIISTVDLLTISAFWTIFLAFQYSKLWTDGYDWRDVLRQPRDRELGDVLSDFGEEVEATFSKRARERLRTRGHYTSGRPRTRDGVPMAPPAGVPALAPGAVDATLSTLAPDVQHEVRRVRLAQGEVSRIFAGLPTGSRRGAPDPRDLAPMVQAGVAAVVRELADDAARGTAGPLAAIEQEIARLEAEANPMDAAGSEARVRRLAQLRRERRRAGDGQHRAAGRVAQLRGCAVALEAMGRVLREWQAAGGGAGDGYVAELLPLMGELGEAAAALTRPAPPTAA